MPYHQVNVSPYAAGGNFCQVENDFKNMQKGMKPWYMGTHLIVLSKSSPINTNMTGFGWFSKIDASLFFWTEVALALEGLEL